MNQFFSRATAGETNFILIVYQLLFAGYLLFGGFYQPLVLWVPVACFAGLAALVAGAGRVRGLFGDYPLTGMLRMAVLISVILCVRRGAWGWWVFPLLLVPALIPVRILREKGCRVVFWVVVVVAVVFRLHVLVAEPSPAIDVFHILTEAGRTLLHGGRLYDVAVTAPGENMVSLFTYPPMAVLFTLPGTLAGDPRWMLVGAEIAAALMLRGLLRRRGAGEEVSLFVPMVVLFHPAWETIVESAWLEPGALLFAVLYLWLAEKRQGLAGWALAGLGTIKQIFFPLMVFGIRGRRVTAIHALAAAGLVCVPFLLTDPAGFYERTVAFYLFPDPRKFHVPPVHLSQSLNTFYYMWSGADIPGIVRWPLTGGLFGWAVWRQPAGVYGVFLASAVFLLGTGLLSLFAFMNYFYMVQMFLLLAAAARVVENGGGANEHPKDAG